MTMAWSVPCTWPGSSSPRPDDSLSGYLLVSPVIKKRVQYLPSYLNKSLVTRSGGYFCLEPRREIDDEKPSAVVVGQYPSGPKTFIAKKHNTMAAQSKSILASTSVYLLQYNLTYAP